MTTTNVSLAWDMLNTLSWNGRPVNYMVSYRAMAGNANTTISVSGTTTMIFPLHFGTEYMFLVAFVSTGGVGPAARLSVLTTQDSEYLHYLLELNVFTLEHL